MEKKAVGGGEPAHHAADQTQPEMSLGLAIERGNLRSGPIAHERLPKIW